MVNNEDKNGLYLRRMMVKQSRILGMIYILSKQPQTNEPLQRTIELINIEAHKGFELIGEVRRELGKTEKGEWELFKGIDSIELL